MTSMTWCWNLSRQRSKQGTKGVSRGFVAACFDAINLLTTSSFQIRSALSRRRQRVVGTQLVEAIGCSALVAFHMSWTAVTKPEHPSSPSRTLTAIDLTSGYPQLRATP